MAKVSIPVLWDGSNQFLNGALISIDARSFASGIVSKPAGKFVPPFVGEVGFVNTLEIKDPTLGTYFAQLTLSQWQTLVSSATQDPNKEKTANFTAAANQTVFTSTSLYNIVPNVVFVNGNKENASAYTYSSSSPNGTISFVSGLSLNDVVTVLYYSI